jgi:fucose 4-O-acetylase-like acetyltransferase
MRFTFIAVPMFFFMSGFYDRTEKSMNEWLPKTANRLIRPAFIWIIIGNLFLKGP